MQGISVRILQRNNGASDVEPCEWWEIVQEQKTLEIRHGGPLYYLLTGQASHTIFHAEVDGAHAGWCYDNNTTMWYMRPDMVEFSEAVKAMDLRKSIYRLKVVDSEEP